MKALSSLAIAFVVSQPATLIASDDVPRLSETALQRFVFSARYNPVENPLELIELSTTELCAVGLSAWTCATRLQETKDQEHRRIDLPLCHDAGLRVVECLEQARAEQARSASDGHLRQLDVGFAWSQSMRPEPDLLFSIHESRGEWGHAAAAVLAWEQQADGWRFLGVGRQLLANLGDQRLLGWRRTGPASGLLIGRHRHGDEGVEAHYSRLWIARWSAPDSLTRIYDVDEDLGVEEVWMTPESPGRWSLNDLIFRHERIKTPCGEVRPTEVDLERLLDAVDQAEGDIEELHQAVGLLDSYVPEGWCP